MQYGEVGEDRKNFEFKIFGVRRNSTFVGWEHEMGGEVGEDRKIFEFKFLTFVGWELEMGI